MAKKPFVGTLPKQPNRTDYLTRVWRNATTANPRAKRDPHYLSDKPFVGTLPLQGSPGGGLQNILAGVANARKAYEDARANNTSLFEQEMGLQGNKNLKQTPEQIAAIKAREGLTDTGADGETMDGEGDLGGGGAGLDLSAFDTAEGSLNDTNTAAQHEIAKGLVDFLNRVTSGRDQYVQATAQQGQQAQGDLNAVLQQNQQQGAPILADLKAQGVDPANVGALIQGDQQALQSQGALDRQFRQQMGSLQEGGFADARSAGAMVEQGAQAQRENNYASSLASIQAGRASARSAYEAQEQQSGANDPGEFSSSAQENLDSYLNKWGPHAKSAFSLLWNESGGDPNKVLKKAQDLEKKYGAGYWEKQHLPQMYEFLTGAIGAFADTKGVAARNGNLTKWAGVQVDSGVQPMFDQLLKANPGLRVNGGWRSAEHNKEVNGVKNSHHLDGTAVDFGGSPRLMEQAAAWARAHGAREVKIHDAGSGKHLHVAW